MQLISLFPPTPQKRPRVTRFVTYDPSKKDKVAFIKSVLNQLPKEPISYPLRISIQFKFKHPKSHLKTNGELRKSAPNLHVSKPDIDNLVKFVLDALNGRLYKDDSQIVSLKAVKQYSETSCIEISVEEIASSDIK